jgi:hypothetical protein
MNTLWLPDRRKPRNHSRNSLRSVGSGPDFGRSSLRTVAYSPGLIPSCPLPLVYRMTSPSRSRAAHARSAPVMSCRETSTSSVQSRDVPALLQLVPDAIVQLLSRLVVGRDDQRALGARGLVWHTLRHEFCSRTAENTSDPVVAQELARHKDLRTTQGYFGRSMSRARAGVSADEHHSGNARSPSGTASRSDMPARLPGRDRRRRRASRLPRVRG